MVNESHIRLAATATRLIKKHGRALVLESTTSTGPAYDPTNTDVEVEIVGVQSQFKANEIDGDLIQRNDRQYLIDSNVELKADMKIKDQGVTYEIKGIDQIMPGETVMLYKAHCRG